MNALPNQSRVVIIIQVRMGSSRLPGKPMKLVAGKPLLSYLIERVQAVKRSDQVLIATTTKENDQPIVQFCQTQGIDCYRGSEDDVLERYYLAAKAAKADIVVRITGDCPLIDPQVVDRVIEYYLDRFPQYAYVSNMLEPGYPRGMDVEVFSFEVLERAYQEALAAEEREHVTLYLYEHPQQFSIGCIKSPTDLSQHRWTVDTDEDFELVSRLLSTLAPKNPLFSIKEVAEQMELHPDWFLINSQIKQKPIR